MSVVGDQPRKHASTGYKGTKHIERTLLLVYNKIITVYTKTHCTWATCGAAAQSDCSEAGRIERIGWSNNSISRMNIFP